MLLPSSLLALSMIIICHYYYFQFINDKPSGIRGGLISAVGTRDEVEKDLTAHGNYETVDLQQQYVMRYAR